MLARSPGGINHYRSLQNFSVPRVWQAHHPQTQLFTFFHFKRTRNVIIKNLKRLKLQNRACNLFTDTALIQFLYRPQTYIGTIHLSSKPWSVFLLSAVVEYIAQWLQCAQLIFLVKWWEIKPRLLPTKRCLIKTKPKHYISSVRMYQGELFRKSHFRNRLNPLKTKISLAAVFLLHDLNDNQTRTVSQILLYLQSGLRYKM